MRLRAMQLTRFMSHEDTSIEFPLTGLVLVTGDNGAGKSAITEGVSMALWGKTLRGTSPWRDDGGSGGFVALGTYDGFDVRRHKLKSRTHVDIGIYTDFDPTNPVAADAARRLDDDDNPTFESATKAQEELQRRVGPYEVWRRTAVFSSQDVDSFTGATDADRKRLLEALLGLDQFDDALVKCRADLMGHTGQLAAVCSEYNMLRTRLAGERQRETDARRALEAAGPAADLVALHAQVDRLAHLLGTCEAELRSADRELAAVAHNAGGHDADLRALQAQLRGLVGDRCDHCGQAIPEQLRAGIKARVDAGLAAQRAAAAKTAEQTRSRREQQAETRDELSHLRAKHNAAQMRLAAAAAAVRSRQAAERTLQQVQAAATVLEAELATAQAAQEALGVKVGQLEAVERVLGLKGVRAHVLGRALAGVEALANVWLAKIAGNGVRLSLRPYTEKKGGGVTDSISLAVEGMGGGLGYRAASGGQRRVVDVALLFALAEVGQAAHSQGVGGTLFFDEVFDAIHSSRIAPLAAAMEEMAKSRLLVVISHSDALVKHLRPDMRLQVVDGTVERL